MPAGRPAPARTRLGRQCRAVRPGWAQRGAGATEIVIVTPLLLLLVLLVIQFALAEQAEHVAQAAATQALATTRAQDGSTAAGHAQADAVLAQLGGSLTSPSVTVARTATQATVTVSGTAETLIPGIRLRVHATVTGPVEEFEPS
jgi:Flp pilus assembly protein TadG